MSDPTLVVMAAGIGSRYGGLKQIEPVGPNGEGVLSYAVYDAIRAGFKRVVLVIRKDIEKQFRERIGRGIERQVDTDYVFQDVGMLPEGFELPAKREKPWGTAHAILCCKNAVDSSFAAINADDFYGPASYRVLYDYLRQVRDGPADCDYCMVGFELGKTLSPHGPVARGICTVSSADALEEVVERLKVRESDGEIRYEEDDGEWAAVPRGSIASMNMWGATPTLFAALEDRFRRFLERHIGEPGVEFLFPVVIGELIRDGCARVKVLRTNETWLGVTYKEDLAAFRQAIADRVERGDYPQKLWG